MFHWGGAKEEQVVSLLMKNHPLKYIAVTHGAEGCHLYHGTEMIDSRAPKVTVVDTVGSGDAFGAAVVLGLLRGDSLQVIADPRQRSRGIRRQPGGRHAEAAARSAGPIISPARRPGTERYSARLRRSFSSSSQRA